MQNSPIEIKDYNPNWPNIFQQEARKIRLILADNHVAIHHIGSTSIPGLAAKPIIDMIPVVKDISVVDNINSAMEQLGYKVMGEYGMLFRRFFQKPGFNIHIYEQYTPDIDRYLKFRDWLNNHPEDKLAYAKLKHQLAEKYKDDRHGYCFAKDEFIASIDIKTGFNGTRIVKALSENEWNKVKYFRQQYFFGPANITEQYAWTFNDPNHIHLVLYQATSIIGYAHIQIWPDKRANLRMIVIDQVYQAQDFGSKFLNSIERWLKLQNIKTLHIQSTPKAINFYNKHHYNKMPVNDPDGHPTDPQDIEIGKIL